MNSSPYSSSSSSSSLTSLPMSCFGCVPSGRKEAKRSKIEDSARIRPNPRLSAESSSGNRLVAVLLFSDFWLLGFEF